VRRRAAVNKWGSSAAERAATYPCDGLIERPDGVLFRAVDVEAPTAVVFRWLCQLRVAPYSYDWIDNLGRQSPRELIDGLDDLEVGDRVATVFELVAFEPDRSFTIGAGGSAGPSLPTGARSGGVPAGLRGRGRYGPRS
jgi:hypothetical protein